jgi:hypothetical protein
MKNCETEFRYLYQGKVDSLKNLRWRHDVSEAQFRNCFCYLMVLMALNPTFRSIILTPFLVFFASRAAEM